MGWRRAWLVWTWLLSAALLGACQDAPRSTAPTAGVEALRPAAAAPSVVAPPSATATRAPTATPLLPPPTVVAPPTVTAPPTATAAATMTAAPPTATNAPTPAARVDVTALHVRQGPGFGYAVLMTVGEGAELVVEGKTPDDFWLRVRTPGGEVGWVRTEYVSPNVALGSVAVAEAPPLPTVAPVAVAPTTPAAAARPSAPAPAQAAAAPAVAPPPTSDAAAPPIGPPPAAPASAPVAAGQPVRIRIPKIGVDAAVEGVGQDADGAMSNPSRWESTAWYRMGPRPGEAGNAVISGHLDSTTGPAVFWSLSQLRAGDRVSVTDAGGTTREFVVESTAVYPFDQAPLARIFGFEFRPRLNLITCRGEFNRSSQNYNQRFVVYTRLAE